jgi:hypothetical protein
MTMRGRCGWESRQPRKGREAKKEPKEQPKKTLQDVCLEMKRQLLAEEREREAQKREAASEAEYEDLSDQIYGSGWRKAV